MAQRTSTDDLYLRRHVWFEGVEGAIRRFPINLHRRPLLAAARIPIVNSHLNTAAEAVRFAQASPKAAIVPVHFEG